MTTRSGRVCTIPEEVRAEMRIAWANGVGLRQIAARFGVSRQQAFLALKGYRWRAGDTGEG